MRFGCAGALQLSMQFGPALRHVLLLEKGGGFVQQGIWLQMHNVWSVWSVLRASFIQHRQPAPASPARPPAPRPALPARHSAPPLLHAPRCATLCPSPCRWIPDELSPPAFCRLGELRRVPVDWYDPRYDVWRIVSPLSEGCGGPDLGEEIIL